VKKISKNSHSSMNELNITPLLDLAFVLLVIFIITTPQLSNDLEMNLPSPKQIQPPGPPPKVHRIVIDPQGHITFNNQPMELPALKDTLMSLHSSEGTNATVVVKGANDVEYDKVIGVLDLLQQAFITKVGLATEAVQ
jgi:biopolymer transport protein ExbD